MRVTDLEVRADDARGVLVHEAVVDDRDAARRRIARDLVAKDVEVVALVDDVLRADLRERARDVDLVVVGRHREAVEEARLPDDAERERVGFLRVQVRITAVDLRHRVVQAAERRVVDGAADALAVEPLRRASPRGCRATASRATARRRGSASRGRPSTPRCRPSLRSRRSAPRDSNRAARSR